MYPRRVTLGKLAGVPFSRQRGPREMQGCAGAGWPARGREEKRLHLTPEVAPPRPARPLPSFKSRCRVIFRGDGKRRALGVWRERGTSG